MDIIAIAVIGILLIVISVALINTNSKLDRIDQMTDEELDRVEKHGGVTGYPGRVKKVSRRD